MNVQNNTNFYSNLPAHEEALWKLLDKPLAFASVPANWHVIITDIKNSTQSVLSGGHEDVNLIATGSIVTVLNIAFAEGVTVPFFFGGDGATFLVPPSLIEKLMDALAIYRTNTLTTFNLEIRTGTIAVQRLYDEGATISIAKFRSSRAFEIPVVIGNALRKAEEIIKGHDYIFNDTAAGSELNLNGMQCRWDKIPMPEGKEEIVTLLIVAADDALQSKLFKQILKRMDEIYGTPETRQPISVAKLRLKTTFNRLSTEMRARIGKIRWFELLKEWLLLLYGKIYFRTEKGQTYLKSLVEMSDTLVMDGKINTVISGTKTQRQTFQLFLDQLEQNNEIYYGIHISGASIMSCYVRNLDDGHIHFVDGSEGGYTKAANVLKQKMKSVTFTS